MFAQWYQEIQNGNSQGLGGQINAGMRAGKSERNDGQSVPKSDTAGHQSVRLTRHCSNTQAAERLLGYSLFRPVPAPSIGAK